MASSILRAGSVIRGDAEWCQAVRDISIAEGEEQTEREERIALLLMRLATKNDASEKVIRTQLADLISPRTLRRDAVGIANGLCGLSRKILRCEVEKTTRLSPIETAPRSAQYREADGSRSGDDSPWAAGEATQDTDEIRVRDWVFRPGEVSFNGSKYFDVAGVKRRLLLRLARSSPRTVSTRALIADSENESMEVSTLRGHISNLNGILMKNLSVETHPITSSDGAYRLKVK
jgi:hypothetical protein